jgi:hypothetical protein
MEVGVLAGFGVWGGGGCSRRGLGGGIVHRGGLVAVVGGGGVAGGGGGGLGWHGNEGVVYAVRWRRLEMFQWVAFG